MTYIKILLLLDYVYIVRLVSSSPLPLHDGSVVSPRLSVALIFFPPPRHLVPGSIFTRAVTHTFEAACLVTHNAFPLTGSTCEPHALHLLDPRPQIVVTALKALFFGEKHARKSEHLAYKSLK